MLCRFLGVGWVERSVTHRSFIRIVPVSYVSGIIQNEVVSQEEQTGYGGRHDEDSQ